MKRADEETLERGCKAGDADALNRTFELLKASHAYTRARASEILTLAPERLLAERLLPIFDREFPAGIVWRIVEIYVEDHGHVPGGDALKDLLRRRMEAAPSSLDPDALFHAIRTVGTVFNGQAAHLLERWIAHEDDEIALLSASTVAAERNLGPSELERLSRIRSKVRVEALVLRVDQGDREAIEPLARMIPKAGPYAFMALELLEERGNAETAELLRSYWRSPWSVGHIAARIASTCVVLGDREALTRLRMLQRGWRRATRAVAMAELLRVGTDEDAAAIVRLVKEGRPEGPHIVSEAWRCQPVRARAALEGFLKHPEPEIRMAAWDSIGEMSPADDWLHSLASRPADPDEGVAELAHSTLKRLGF